jgi:asparagine synthase (glutamine-hydrolysing)
MCGVAGWVDWVKDLSQEHAAVERMAETLNRRGPDEKGAWLCERAALGHRRLSVIDPAHGQQPMVFKDASRTFALVYNGELYNFAELRAELETAGHSFRTRCDTEVVLHAYMEWGADCVTRFDGIFAFAVWDAAAQRLFLARDRLGVKPLYFAQDRSSFFFGSEIKAILAHGQVPAEVDNLGLAELFVASPYCYTPTPGVTPFRNIHEVRPGHHLTVEAGRVVTRQYWQLVSKPHSEDAEATVRRAAELFEGAVKRQLVSDVPLACLLSGGLDSSGVAAVAQGELSKEKKRLQTWVVDFVEAERDFVKYPFLSSRDAPFAAEAATYLHAEHHPVVLETPEMLDNMLDIMRARDLPTGSQVDTSLLLLFKALKREATVALSGEAGDEVFGGYTWFWNPDNTGRFPWTGPKSFFSASAEVIARTDPQGYLERRYVEAAAEVPRLEGESVAVQQWREKVYMGLTRWLPNLLIRKDRIGMFAGVEGRVPFCDHKLVEYLWNVPAELQNKDGVEKHILRRMLGGKLPASILERKKSVYPFFEHMAYQLGVIERARDILADSSSPATQLFDTAELKARCDEWDTPSSKSTHRVGLLERYIQVDAWLREYHISLV